MTTMKAIRMYEYGPASVLRYEDAPLPDVGSDEVRVAVSAVGVNPVDWKIRAGYLQAMLPLAFPWTPGLDFSGVIEKVGANVTSFAVGDEVFGKTDLPHDGSYAEFVTVSTRGIVHKPQGIGYTLAAAIPCAALTAWQALFGDGSIKLAAGQTLLILGAAGGVGSFAVQLAKWKGIRVIAAGRAAQESYLRSLGADAFIDTALEDLSSAGEVDAVLDLVGGDLQERGWAQLIRGGVYASTISAPDPDKAIDRTARTLFVFTQTNAQQLEDISALVEMGTINVHVAKTFPLEKAGEAHTHLESHGIAGKTVLVVR